MQCEKIGHGLLDEVFPSEGECFVSRKRERENKKGPVLENGGEHWSTLNKRALMVPACQ